MFRDSGGVWLSEPIECCFGRELFLVFLSDNIPRATTTCVLSRAGFAITHADSGELDWSAASALPQLECPVLFVPVGVRETDMRGTVNDAKKEAFAGTDR